MDIVDLENILRSQIRSCQSLRNDPRVSPVDKVVLNEKFNWALGMVGYVQKIKQAQEVRYMIEGLFIGKGKVSELSTTRLHAPSKLELAIVAKAKEMAPDDRVDIDPAVTPQKKFSVMLGSLKKAGKVGKDYGLRKNDIGGYSFCRFPSEPKEGEAVSEKPRASNTRRKTDTAKAA